MLRPDSYMILGSSPLARGLLHRPGPFGRDGGIIPARAGFTTGPDGTRTVLRDHPRSRGVYFTRPSQIPLRTGSSPLARGLQWVAGPFLCPPGIIPARAGFTRAHAGRRRRPADHPRSRGVYNQRKALQETRCGSSPLARGLPQEGAPEHDRPRIIPARAGFTTRSSRWHWRARDHPRSRGVYEMTTKSHGEESGIIPARAGFTLARGGAAAEDQDHPRSRGVYVRPRVVLTEPVGSSPLARGLPPPQG